MNVIICAQMSTRLPGAYCRPGERHIAEPSGVGPGVEDECTEQHDAAEQVDPVAEGIQTRERDIARADHQRHEVDGHRLP